jgi:O-antigen/teichoic acid export membrane protein
MTRASLETPQTTESTDSRTTASKFQSYSAKVSRQSSVFLAGTVWNVVCSYLFKVFVSRVLGASAIGLYALGQSIVEILSTFASLGLPKTLARWVAVYQGTGQEGKIQGLVAKAVALVLFGTGFLGILLFAGRNILAERVFGEPELAEYLPLFALLLPLAALNTLVAEYLRGHQEVARRTLITQFVQLPLWILATLGFFGFGWRLKGYLGAEILASLVALTLLGWLAGRRTPSSDSGTPFFPRLEPAVQSYAGTMMGLNVVSFLSHRFDVILIGILLTSDQVGVYSVAVAASSFVPTLLMAVNSIFGPIISDLHTRGESEVLARLFQSTTKWVFGFTFPLVAVLLGFSPALMGVFGVEFRSGGPVLALLALGHLINVGTGSVGNLLVMSGHQRLELRSSLIVTVITLALHLLLIPRWGILGAATALATSLVCANLLRLFLVRRYLGLWAYNRSWLRLAFALGASSLAVWGVRRLPWQVGSGELIGFFVALAVAYLAFSVTALFCLNEDDRLLAEAVWKNVRRRLPTSKP